MDSRGFMVPNGRSSCSGGGGGSESGLSFQGRMTKPKAISSDFKWGKKSNKDEKSKTHHHREHSRSHHHHHSHHSHSRDHSHNSHHHHHHHHSHSHHHKRSSSSSSSSPYSSEDELTKGVEPKKPKIDNEKTITKETENEKKSSGLDLDALLLKQGILPNDPPPPPPPKKHEITQNQPTHETKIDDTVDLNELAAQAMREKLKGNITEYERIQSQLERLRDPQSKVNDQPQTVIIRRNKKINSNDYDEENADMKTLYMREKGRNYDKVLAMSIINGLRNSSANIIDYSNEYGYDNDDGNNSYGDFSAPKKLTQQQIERRERKETQRLIREHIRAENRLRDCYFCLENDRCEKKFVISLGESVYLALPVKGSLTKFHCLIVPSNHVTSIRSADEDVLEEIEKYKTGLLRMFHTMGMEPIFMETCLNTNSGIHTFIDVIPFERSVAGDAPMFFKEGLTNCETEWSQHKKIIDTRGKKLAACIPPNFPYFHVDFDGKGGFLHVVESARDFTHYFGRSIAASILQVSPELYIKPHRKSPLEEEADIKAFTKAWAPFDWTISHKDD